MEQLPHLVRWCRTLTDVGEKPCAAANRATSNGSVSRARASTKRLSAARHAATSPTLPESTISPSAVRRARTESVPVGRRMTGHRSPSAGNATSAGTAAAPVSRCSARASRRATARAIQSRFSARNRCASEAVEPGGTVTTTPRRPLTVMRRRRAVGLKRRRYGGRPSTGSPGCSTIRPRPDATLDQGVRSRDAIMRRTGQLIAS